MGLLSKLGFGNSVQSTSSTTINLNLNVATKATEVSIGSAVDKSVGSAQLGMVVKTQDTTGKTLDLAVNSLLNKTSTGILGKTDLSVATQTDAKTSTSVFSSVFDASKSGLAGQVNLGVKAQDGLNKSLDFAANSIFGANKDGATGKTDLGLAIQNGTKTATALFDGIAAIGKDGAAGQADLGVKVQDGLSKAFDFANSSVFEANKDGAAGKTDLGLAILNGTKTTAVLFNNMFSADSLSFVGKTGLEAQSQDPLSKFNFAGASLFAADNTGAAAQTDIGMLVQNAQKLATLKVSDLLQVGQEAIEFSGNHALNVSGTEGNVHLPLFSNAAEIHSILPLQHETALV
ncbi:hypothetical protein [Pseudomonas sp. 30_B]|uniref:hypothetical protein n=1 Tax=Pseudomonas sp. 30_B TaxID=2813575 RepID=UPI001A9CC8F5|nr:hypothetical protein [Pseudomonas sp. 30_B]